MVAMLPIVALLFWGGVYVARFQSQVDRVELLREYKTMHRNIYVISQHEDDATVLQRAKEEEELVQESGNGLGIKVVKLIYKDGHPNETWDEFQQRAALFIREDIEARDAYLKQRGGEDFYYRNVLNQL
jgi:hypothetical protein